MFWKIDIGFRGFVINKIDVFSVHHFITLTIVHGIFKIGVDVEFGKLSF